MGEKTILSKDAILKVKDIKTVPEDVPEWGGTVYLREISGQDREAFERAMFSDEGGIKKDAPPLRPALLALCLSDADGNRLFTDKEISDLAKKNGAVIARLFAKAQEVSGLGPGAVEAAEKN